jgi:hypothetical protein
LCILILAAAISVFALPRSGCNHPLQNSQTRRVEQSLRFVKKKKETYSKSVASLPGFHVSELLRETIRVSGGCDASRANRRRRDGHASVDLD